VDKRVCVLSRHEFTRRSHKDGEKKIEAFLTHVGVNKNVAPSTQNQAMKALVFLYRKVLKHQLDEGISAVRANKKMHLPVVMTREETAKL